MTESIFSIGLQSERFVEGIHLSPQEIPEALQTYEQLLGELAALVNEVIAFRGDAHTAQGKFGVSIRKADSDACRVCIALHEILGRYPREHRVLTQEALNELPLEQQFAYFVGASHETYTEYRRDRQHPGKRFEKYLAIHELLRFAAETALNSPGMVHELLERISPTTLEQWAGLPIHHYR